DRGFCAEDAQALLHALRRGADNVSGNEVPHFVSQIFASLPAPADGLVVPNYIEKALKEAQRDPRGVRPSPGAATQKRTLASAHSNAPELTDLAAPGDGRTPLSRYAGDRERHAHFKLITHTSQLTTVLWRQLLARRRAKRISVLEPA